MSLLSPRLLAFIAVAKHKTVHQAASYINLTQTAVTQRIKALEHSLKTTLFVRTRKGMVLTPEGEELLRYCNVINGFEGEVLARLQGHYNSELEVEIAITAQSSFMRSRIIPNLVPILKKFSNLFINFRVDDGEKRYLHLKSGQSDFVIVNENQLTPEMSFKRLEPEQYILVCSPVFKNRTLVEIIKNHRIVDFNHEDQMTFDYLKKFNLDKYQQNRRYFANNTVNIAQLVVDGIGYSVLPAEFAKPYLKEGKLMVLNDNKTLELNPFLAWYERPYPPEYFQKIVDSIY